MRDLSTDLYLRRLSLLGGVATGTAFGALAFVSIFGFGMRSEVDDLQAEVAELRQQHVLVMGLIGPVEKSPYYRYLTEQNKKLDLHELLLKVDNRNWGDLDKRLRDHAEKLRLLATLHNNNWRAFKDDARKDILYVYPALGGNAVDKSWVIDRLPVWVDLSTDEKATLLPFVREGGRRCNQ